jgi:isopentenyl phosphate kinase
VASPRALGDDRAVQSRPVPQLLALKIGGSLFSDKRSHRHVDERAMCGYARLIAQLNARAGGRLILIVGGGAHAHATVTSADRDDPLAHIALTDANFALLSLWSELLRERGVPAVPLQLAAMGAIDADGLSADTRPLARWLALGALPVLCGDCLPGPGGELRVVSSDQTPELALSLGLGPVRVVALTDVPGVLTDGPDGTSVLRDIDPDRPERAREALWEPPAWDISQAMGGKLDALLRCARAGAECFIMRGSPDAQSLCFLLEPLERWPSGLVYTRIVRRRSRAIVRR